MHQAHGSGFYAPIEKHIYIYTFHTDHLLLYRETCGCYLHRTWTLLSSYITVNFRHFYKRRPIAHRQTMDALFFFRNHPPYISQCWEFAVFYTLSHYFGSDLIWSYISLYILSHIIYLFPLGRACRSHFIWHIMCREAVPSSSSQEKYKQKSSNWDTAWTYAAH